MTSTRSPLLLWLGLALALGASLYSLSFRYRVESRNRAVELLVEMETVESLAAAQGLRLPDALTLLKAKGIGAVVLSEQSIGELIDDGQVQLQSSNGIPNVAFTGADQPLNRVRRGVQNRFGDIENKGPRIGMVGNRIDIEGISPSALRAVEVGLDPEWCEVAQAAGLRIYARGGNPTGATERTVRETLKWLRETGAEVFLPQGEQVLGRRDQLNALVTELAASNMLYASPEFTKLGGDLNTIAAAPERVVRLHSAQAAEMDKMTLGDAVERYVRAGRERNIRALLLRPLTLAAERPLDAFGDLASAIQNRLIKEGGAVGPAKPFEAPNVPRWLSTVIGLGAALAALYVLLTLVAHPWAAVALGILAFLAGAGAWTEAVRPYTALMAALVFPIAAFVFLESRPKFGVFGAYAMVTLLSVVGGLAVAGLLNDLPYFIRADQFAGVKAAHFLPVFVVGAYFTVRLVSWRDGLNSPITWLQALLALFILAALGFMFLRTGNDNPAGVSGIELKLRSLLDNILPVRPRTKEFMFGYPALVIGLGLLARVRAGGAAAKPLAGWAVLALMVGTIGPTSAVNTMCHLHTPLDVGLLRIAVGFIVGGIIGAAAWFVVRWRLPNPGT